MHSCLKQNFEINKIYCNNTNLYVDVCKDIKIIPYQIDMISKNNIPGLSKFHITSDHDSVKFIFDIAGSMPVGHYLLSRAIEKRKFIFLIKRILSLITNSKSYLLCENNFILRADTVFIDKCEEIRLVYVPCDISNNFNEQIRDFILDLLTQYVQFNDDDANKFFMHMIYLLRDKNFSVGLFEDYILSHFEDDRCCLIQEESESNEKEEKDEKPLIKKQKKIKGIHINIILFSVYGFACTAALIMVKNQVRDKRFILSLFMLFAGTGVLIFKKLFQRNACSCNAIESADNEKLIYNTGNFDSEVLHDFDDYMPFSSAKNDANAGDNIKSSGNSGMSESDIDCQKSNLIAEYQTQILSPEMLCEGKNAFYGILQSCEDDSKDIVAINKDEFYIGRLTGSVDYVCKSKAVGKIHAKFIRTDEGYCLEDLNSRNGTYLNGSKLLPDLPYPLKNGDILTFADVEYVFSHSCK